MPKKKAPKPKAPPVERINPPVQTCCLCGSTFIGWGNNPFPLSEKEDDRCCDECNYTKVIPARLAKIAEDYGKLITQAEMEDLAAEVSSGDTVEVHRGYEIDYNIFGNHEYSVQYFSVTYIFDSVTEARTFIDNCWAYESGDIDEDPTEKISPDRIRKE